MARRKAGFGQVLVRARQIRLERDHILKMVNGFASLALRHQRSAEHSVRFGARIKRLGRSYIGGRTKWRLCATGFQGSPLFAVHGALSMPLGAAGNYTRRDGKIFKLSLRYLNCALDLRVVMFGTPKRCLLL